MTVLMEGVAALEICTYLRHLGCKSGMNSCIDRRLNLHKNKNIKKRLIKIAIRFLNVLEKGNVTSYKSSKAAIKSGMLEGGGCTLKGS